MDGLWVFRVGQASVCLGPHLDKGWGRRAVKPVWALQWNIFAGCSRVVLLLWVVCVVCVLCLSALAIWSPEGKGLTSWLLFVMFIVILLLDPDGCKHNILRVHEGGHKMKLSLEL